MRTTTRLTHWFRWAYAHLPHLAVIMLATGSSVQVYHFLRMFYSAGWAAFIAASYDLSVIGLAALPPKGRAFKNKMMWLAFANMVVALSQSWLFDMFHIRPDLLIEWKRGWRLPLMTFIASSPTILNFFMSWLVIHKPADGTRATPLSVPKRPSSATPRNAVGRPKVTGTDRFVKRFEVGEEFTRRHIVQRLVMSPASASRLINELLAQHIIVQQGNYYIRIADATQARDPA